MDTTHITHIFSTAAHCKPPHAAKPCFYQARKNGTTHTTAPPLPWFISPQCFRNSYRIHVFQVYPSVQGTRNIRISSGMRYTIQYIISQLSTIIPRSARCSPLTNLPTLPLFLLTFKGKNKSKHSTPFEAANTNSTHTAYPQKCQQQ